MRYWTRLSELRILPNLPNAGKRRGSKSGNHQTQIQYAADFHLHNVIGMARRGKRPI